jgi:hypothetical protein
MRRRELIALAGCAALVLPLGLRAQAAERVRKFGLLMSLRADDPEGQMRIKKVARALQELGWIEGQSAHRD